VIGRFSNTFFVKLLSTNHTALTSPVKWLLIYQKGNTRSSCGVTGKAVNCSKTTMNAFVISGTISQDLASLVKKRKKQLVYMKGKKT